jgi:hypothetical protein
VHEDKEFHGRAGGELRQKRLDLVSANHHEPHIVSVTRFEVFDHSQTRHDRGSISIVYEPECLSSQFGQSGAARQESYVAARCCKPPGVKAAEDPCTDDENPHPNPSLWCCFTICALSAHLSEAP